MNHALAEFTIAAWMILAPIAAYRLGYTSGALRAVETARAIMEIVIRHERDEDGEDGP